MKRLELPGDDVHVSVRLIDAADDPEHGGEVAILLFNETGLHVVYLNSQEQRRVFEFMSALPTVPGGRSR